MSMSVMRIEMGIDIHPELTETKKHWLGEQIGQHVKLCIDAIQDKRKQQPVDWASVPPLGEA